MNNYNLWEKVTLPPELLSRLNAMIRRIRLLQLTRGLLATAGVAFASILVVMGVDAALVIYSDAIRLGLSLAALALTLLTAYIALWRPLADPITPVRMARIVETRHPELQERISSALELIGAGGGAAAEGSGQLLEILASDAAADITGVSARDEFRGTTLRPVIVSVSVVFAILLVLFVGWPRQSALLFARAVAPGAPLGNLAARGFSVTPGDSVIVAGESILFTLTAPGETGSRAELCIERPGEPLAIERLARRFSTDDAEAVFELEMPAIHQSFRYRMRLGNALTRYYSVTAVPPPAHGPFDCILSYPDYTGLGTTQFTAAAAVRLSAPIGTRAGVRTTLNRKMDATLHIGGRALTPTESLPADEVTFDWLVEPLNGPARWGLSLRDARGFTNAPVWALYEPVPDYAPHVQLTYPTGNAYTLPTFGLLKLVYALRDDYGLSQTQLAILPDNDRTPWHVDLEPAVDGDHAWNVAHELSLAEFQLGGARSLRIWLEVSDNLPPHLGGPNVSKSRVVAVNLDNGQKRSLADQVRIPEREALTNLLETAARRLEEAARKIADVTNQTDVAVINKALQEAATVADKAVEEVGKAADTAEKGLFAGVSEDVRDVAEQAVGEAAEATAETVAAEDEDERRRLAKEALAALNAAAEETRDLVPEILEKDKVLEEASAIESAAAEEARLAQKAMERQLTDAEMTDWQAKQEELADKVDAYDLRNEILDKEEPFVAGGEVESGKWKVESADGRAELDQTGERGKGNREQPDTPTNKRTNEQTNKPPREAASAARAAARAAEEAKAVDVDEKKLQMARQGEAAARESKRAATEAQRAVEALKSLERDREELEAVRDAAEATAREASELADDALQVRLEAVREMAAAIPPDVAKAMDLARRSEDLAALADKAIKAAEDGHPIAPEALAAKAAALRSEAEELAKAAAGNPFLKQSAEMAAEVARKAEEAVAGLRAAMREGNGEEAVQQGLEKAAEAAETATKAAEGATDNAERAASDAQENAVKSAGEAATIAEEAEKLHEELQQAIAASRAALAPGEQVEGQKSNVESPDGRAELDQAGKSAKRINEQATALAARAAEAAKQAQAAESIARQKQAGLSADTAQKARQAADAARRSAEATAQAAQAELAGQKPQADQKGGEAKRLAEEATRNAKAAKANADLLAVPAAEHARRAADAAKRAAALASGEQVENGKRNVESGDGRAELDQSGKSAAETAAAAIKAAREAAAAAEKVAADRRENLPVEAARAARTAADHAEAALKEQEESPDGRTVSDQNQQTSKPTAHQTAALEAAQAAAKAARRAASRPDEQVAELANEGRLASKALGNVGEKVADAARLAQESAAEKKAAAGDAEKIAAADAKAEEARRLFEDARREAHSIGQGLAQLAAETQPVIANAERIAREEAEALKRLEAQDQNGAPAPLPETLPGQIALQGARDVKRLLEENRQAAGQLENVGNWGMGNPNEAIRQSEALASRASQAAERAEALAEMPGIREEGTGNGERGTENAERGMEDEEPGTRNPSSGYSSREAAALGEQVASARQQTEEARATLDSAMQQTNGSTVQRSNDATVQRSNGSTVQRPSGVAAAAATAEATARTAEATATKAAERANSSLENRQNRASTAREASEKASQKAATSVAKLAESAGKLVAEEALRAAGTDKVDSQKPNVESPDGRTKFDRITGESLFNLVSHISSATGKATAARELANTDSAVSAAAEADEAIREARLMQEPTVEQVAAAREAYKAALAMRKLAQEHAEKAGLDTETMKAKKTGDGRKRARDPNRPKKPAPTQKDGGGGGQHEETEEEEYEDGLSLEMPEWLRKLGFPRSEWLKYKGSLESGLPDGALDKVAPEYRDLVRRYFELLSKEK